MWNILKKSQVEKERGIYQVLSLIDEFPKCQSRFVDWRPHFEPAARGAFFFKLKGATHQNCPRYLYASHNHHDFRAI